MKTFADTQQTKEQLDYEKKERLRQFRLATEQGKQDALNGLPCNPQVVGWRYAYCQAYSYWLVTVTKVTT